MEDKVNFQASSYCSLSSKIYLSLFSTFIFSNKSLRSVTCSSTWVSSKCIEARTPCGRVTQKITRMVSSSTNFSSNCKSDGFYICIQRKSYAYVCIQTTHGKKCIFVGILLNIYVQHSNNKCILDYINIVNFKQHHEHTSVL